MNIEKIILIIIIVLTILLLIWDLATSYFKICNDYNCTYVRSIDIFPSLK